jgi:hypothetical protein
VLVCFLFQRKRLFSSLGRLLVCSLSLSLSRREQGCFARVRSTKGKKHQPFGKKKLLLYFSLSRREQGAFFKAPGCFARVGAALVFLLSLSCFATRAKHGESRERVLCTKRNSLLCEATRASFPFPTGKKQPFPFP